jgi:hypothetical protein
MVTRILGVPHSVFVVFLAFLRISIRKSRNTQYSCSALLYSALLYSALLYLNLLRGIYSPCLFLDTCVYSPAYLTWPTASDIKSGTALPLSHLILHCGKLQNSDTLLNAVIDLFQKASKSDESYSPKLVFASPQPCRP